MTRCRNCGTQNLDSSQYCDECGTKLISSHNNSSDIPAFRSQASEAPVFRGANVTSVGIPPIVEEKKSAEGPLIGSEEPPSQAAHAKLTVERGDSAGLEFMLTAAESYIGRWDADNGVFPDVDLDSHDQEAKVSRRHARITMQQGKYMIEDLGSTNGTYVNRGRRLLPGNTNILNDGDEIIVGKTFLRFHINK